MHGWKTLTGGSDELNNYSNWSIIPVCIKYNFKKLIRKWNLIATAKIFIIEGLFSTTLIPSIFHINFTCLLVISQNLLEKWFSHCCLGTNWILSLLASVGRSVCHASLPTFKVPWLHQIGLDFDLLVLKFRKNQISLSSRRAFKRIHVTPNRKQLLGPLSLHLLYILLKLFFKFDANFDRLHWVI